MSMVRVSGRACIVALPAELMDYDEAPILEACGQAGLGDGGYIVLDFGAVERMNGLGATMLVKLCARSRKRRQKVLAYGVGEHYRGVLRVTGLERVVSLHGSEAEALQAAGEPSESPPCVIEVTGGRARSLLDAGSWARPVRRLEVPEMPPEAVSLNVDGLRAVGPVEGFGQLWQKVYRQPLAGVGVSPAEAIKVLKEHFPEFQPPENRFYASAAGIAPGEIVLINSSTPGGPVHTGVMVLYADEESFTFITPQGHPESGWVTFSAFEQDGHTVVQILGLARANDPLYEAAFRVVGAKVQERIWRHVLSSMAAHLGARPDVDVRKECVDTGLQWSGAANIWYNAQVRSLVYAAGAPLRRIANRARR
jgi:anti-anti-sigma regulatory factor